MKKKAKKQEQEPCGWCGNPDATWPWYSVTIDYFIVQHPAFPSPTVIWRRHEVPDEETRERVRQEVMEKMPGCKCIEPDYVVHHWRFWVEKENDGDQG